jgi:hypothetical protein
MKAQDDTRHQPEPLAWALFAMLKKHLLTDTNTEQRLCFSRPKQAIEQTRGPEFAHAIGHGTLPWQNEPIAAIDCLGLITDEDAMRWRHVFERFGHRAQITHPVINNHDVLHKAFSN